MPSYREACNMPMLQRSFPFMIYLRPGPCGLGRWGWGVGWGCILYSVYYQYIFILILTRNNFLLKKSHGHN